MGRYIVELRSLMPQHLTSVTQKRRWQCPDLVPWTASIFIVNHALELTIYSAYHCSTVHLLITVREMHIITACMSTPSPSNQSIQGQLGYLIQLDRPMEIIWTLHKLE